MTKKAEKRKHLDGKTETKSKKMRTSEKHDLNDDSLKKSGDLSLSSTCDINRREDSGIKQKKKKRRRSENGDLGKNVDNIESNENNSVITPDHELPVTNDHKKKNSKSDKDSIINDNVTDIDNVKELSESKKKKKTKEKFDDSTSSYFSGNDLLDMSNESKSKKSDDKMDQSSNSNTNIEKQNLSKVKKCKKAKKKKQKDKSSAENNNVEKEEKTNEKSAKELAVLYLKQWKKHREEWKFQKVRQVWLLTHMYDSEMVSDKDFRTLLKYLDGLKGMGRQTTSAKAQNIVESESDDTVKIDRARQIVQQLSTE